MSADDEEPSVLEYARFHGISRDYTQEPSLEHLELPSFEDLQSDLGNITDDFPTSSVPDYTKERLRVTKEAAKRIQDGRSPPEPPDLESYFEDNRHRVARLKEELPLLRTDPDEDMRHFGNTDIPSFRKLKIPLEVVDTEKGESLEWPSRYRHYPAAFTSRLNHEKIKICREAGVLLHEIMRGNFTKADVGELLDNNSSYKRNPALRPLTPPLFPETPSPKPYIPSSPGNKIDLPSDNSGSTLQEMKELEDRIMKEDGKLVPPDSFAGSGFDDPMLLETGLFAETPEPPVLKRKRTDLKVEVPLTPPSNTSSAEKKLKSVSFSEMLHEYIPDLPSAWKSKSGTSSPADDVSAYFKEIAPAVEAAKLALENEKLDEADTTKRVPVPDLRFPTPVAPWDEFSRKSKGKYPYGQTELEAQQKFLLQVKENHFNSRTYWHGIGELERALSWRPIPAHLENFNLKEKLEMNELVPKLLEELSVADVNSSSLLWKPSGLKILENIDDSDDEIDPVEFSEPEDLDLKSLVKKRKASIEDHEMRKDQNVSKKLKPGPTNHLTPKVTEPRPKHSSANKATATDQGGGLMFGGFSTSAALEKFMAVHGQEVKDPKCPEPSSAERSSTLMPPPPKPVPKNNSSDDRVKKLPTAGVPSGLVREATPKLLALPPIPDVLTPASFIVSSTFLLQRSLARQITKLYPDAVLTDRDFTLPHSPAVEADMSISPSTGLVFTTLQKIKQRSLPGQAPKSPVKDQIVELQVRYERLVVLVSQGLTAGVEPTEDDANVNDYDQAALQDLESFTETLAADVMVKYVAGGEEALARSVVTEIARWGIPHGSKDLGDFKPLQEETYWELFLRRAGINAYASQAILYLLKTPKTIRHPPIGHLQPSIPTSVIKGLPVFICMKQEEREAKFQSLMGGSRILKRVGRDLDRKWPSAVHGFAV